MGLHLCRPLSCLARHSGQIWALDTFSYYRLRCVRRDKSWRSKEGYRLSMLLDNNIYWQISVPAEATPADFTSSSFALVDASVKAASAVRFSSTANG